MYSRHAEFERYLLPFLISEWGKYEAGHLELRVYDLSGIEVKIFI